MEEDYQSLPYYTVSHDLTKYTITIRFLSKEWITKIYHVLPTAVHKAIMFQIEHPSPAWSLWQTHMGAYELSKETIWK